MNTTQEKEIKTQEEQAKKTWNSPRLQTLKISETAFKPPGNCDGSDEYCDPS